MVPDTFKAFVVEEEDGKYPGQIRTRAINDLPDNELLIRVHYSSLNYKDALSATGNKGVTRKYPHTPGIDAVGTIARSEVAGFKEGETVIVTSYDLGMNTDGGFGQYISVPSAWAVKLPDGMTAKEAMILGTAGLTAGMSVLRLTDQVSPDRGTVVVSGATGGVGSLAVAILDKIGYTVAAVSGKEAEQDYLYRLGAAEVISRKEFEEENPRPLLKDRFAGGIDTVGGAVLDTMVKSIHPMGVVTCCGNAASPKLNLTVFPFILRGISLVGIDSQNYPMEKREKVWQRLAGEWKPDQLMAVHQEIFLAGLGEKIDAMLAGKLKGRTLVDLEA
ncbi:MAG: YhdH/YhfP family quinone oxidoreductase [Desulfobacteraceae bacterium]